MSMFTNPGSMFIGAFREKERKVLKNLLISAKKAGYERFVEPAAGAFALSKIAVEAGFQPQNISASDISLFSAVFGRAITGQSIEPLEINSEYFKDYDLTKPEVVLWAQVILQNSMKGASYYQQNVIKDFYERKEIHWQRIKEYIESYREKLGKMNYAEKDWAVHVKEYENDDKAVIVLGLPTYTGGYEKFFDTGNRIVWKEPQYNVFNPKEDYAKAVEWVKTIKPLVIMWEDAEFQQYHTEPFFARHGTRLGYNTYLTVNRMDEYLRLSGGKSATRENEATIKGLKYDYLGEGDEITENSKVEIVSISTQAANYYRLLYTHNFMGGASAGGANYAVLIDGKLAGVFGYNSMLIDFGQSVNGEWGQWLSYSMCIPYKKLRILRLSTMLQCCREIYMRNLSPRAREKATTLFTTMITKYPESKQHRGLMKLYEKESVGEKGWRLHYKAPVVDDSVDEVFKKWYQKEMQYLKTKA